MTPQLPETQIIIKGSSKTIEHWNNSNEYYLIIIIDNVLRIYKNGELQ